jgi:hypothetical protein
LPRERPRRACVEATEALDLAATITGFCGEPATPCIGMMTRGAATNIF